MKTDILTLIVFFMMGFNLCIPVIQKQIEIDAVTVKANPLGDGPGWWDTNWSYYKTITIDNTYIDAELTNFPILVSIDDTTGDKCKSAGEDIRFLLPDNSTELYYEIEKWVDGSNRLVWVNITTVASDSPTVILMYYGNAAAADNQNPNDVWDDDYVGVYHMDETGGNCLDSTINANHGTFIGTLPSRVTGATGYGQDLTIGGADYISLPSGCHNPLVFTWETWFKADSSSAPNRLITDYYNSQNIIQLEAPATNSLKFRAWYANVLRWDLLPADDYDTVWHYWAGAVQTNDATLRLDGTERASDNTVALIDFSFTGMWIGKHGTDAAYTDGVFDEVRISKIRRNDAWLKASFNSQNETTGFLTFGSEQSAPPEWTNSNPVVTADSENPPDTQTEVTLSLANYYGHFNISITDVDNTNQSVNVTWRTNESGSWLDMGYNESSEMNATFYCTNVSWVDTGDTTYWWSVNVSDNHSTKGWDNETFSFKSGWQVSNYLNYRKITIESDYIDNTLTNFPLLVVLDNSSGDYCFHNSGADIEFTSLDNLTRFNHEIESFNNSGNTYCWVNISETMYSDTDYEFLVYYNNSADTTLHHNPTSVWDSNYAGVFHFNGTMDDSTSNNKDLTNYGAASQTDGISAGCYNFTSGDSDYADVATITDVSALTQITIESWARATAIGGSALNAGIMIGEYNSLVDADTDLIWYQIRRDTGQLQCIFATPYQLNVYLANISANQIFENHIWSYAAMAVDENVGADGTLWSYANGELVGFNDTSINGSTDFSNITVDEMNVGRDHRSGADYYFDGSFDEIRISKILRNGSWLNASYHSQNQTTGFTTIGSEQPEPEVNNPPTVESPNPSNGATDISTSLSQISVWINDTEGDGINWTIETSPDIGNQDNSTAEESNGSKICAVSGLQTHITYTWYVNATDTGSGNWTNNTYTFTTPNTAPTQTGESPANQSTGIGLTPSLHVICNDADGEDTLTATWKSNSTYSNDQDYPLKAYIIEHNVTYTKMWAEGMCKLDSGTILCLVKRGTQGSNVLTDICIQNSTDNGTTWGDLTLIKEHDETYGYLAKELFIAPNGSLIFHYLEYEDRYHSYVCQMHSNDNGVTWIDDGRVAGTTTYYGHIGNAIILADGYTIVVALSESVSTSYDNSEVMISTNNGTSWTRSSQVPRPGGEDGVYEPTVVELSNGTLVMYCRSPGNGYLWKTFSTNNGSTWSEAVNSGIIAPSAPADLLRYSWTPSIILMAWDNDTTNRYPLNISVSYDECETWHNESLLQNGSLGDAAYPRFMFGTTTDDDMIFVSAWINDPSYADTMGYRFPFSWLNASGLETWTTFATNTSISPGTNITQTNSNFSAYNTTYYWSVNLTDGTNWTNETYHFTTAKQWVILDTWNITLSNLTISPFIIDTWNLTLSNTPEATILDTWNLTLGNLTVSPFTIDTWNITLSNTTYDAVTITRVSYSPTNIRINDTSYVNILFNITTGWTSINQSSLLFAHTINQTGVGNGLNFTYRILKDSVELRSMNRDEDLWFEKFNASGTGELGYPGEWGVHDNASVKFNVVDSGSNWTTVKFDSTTSLVPHMFSNIWYIDRTDLQDEIKTSQIFDIYGNFAYKAKFNMTGTDFYSDPQYNNSLYQFYYNANDTGAPGKPLKIYLYNASYTYGRPAKSDYCVLLKDHLDNDVADYSIRNSSYWGLNFSTNDDGYVGTLKLTEEFGFIFVGKSGDISNKYDLAFCDSNVSDRDYNNSDFTEYSSDGGDNWAIQNGTIDCHLKFAKLDNTSRIDYKVYANDTSGNEAWSTVYTDLIDIVNVPPNPSNVLTQNGTITEYNTYDVINITYTWIGDPNQETCWVNTTCHDSSHDVVAYIENRSITHSEVEVNLTWWIDWGTAGVAAGGPYHINITITDPYNLATGSTSNGTFNLVKQWVTLDTWNITLSNTLQPYTLDTWNLTLGNLTISSYVLDTWNITLSNTPEATILDTWNLTLGNATISQFTIDTWNVTLSNLTISPFIIDTWNLTLSNIPQPYTLDTWNLTLGNLTISPFIIDTWNLTLSNTPQPYILDIWNITLGNMSISSYTLDTWNLTLGNLTISPFTIDQWNITLSDTSLFIANVTATPSEVVIDNVTINITCNVTSPNAIVNVTVNMTDGSYDMASGTGDLYYYNVINSTIGTHYYHIYANDSSGDQLESAIYSFKIIGISCSFTYTVSGGLMTLTPTIEGATHYQWTFINETGVEGITPWIPIEDIGNHIQGYVYPTTIRAFLSAKNINFNQYANYSDIIKIYKSSYDKPEPVVEEPEPEPTNVFKEIADAVGKWFGERNIGEILFMVVISIIISLFVIRQKYPQKKIIYPILKKKKKEKKKE